MGKRMRLRMTEAKKRRLARELDTRVRYLRLTGLDGIALFLAMADHMVDFRALIDAVGPGGMALLSNFGPVVLTDIGPAPVPQT